jgi:general secretion pathway protein D
MYRVKKRLLILLLFWASGGLLLTNEPAQKKFYIKNIDLKIIQIQIQPLLSANGKMELNQERKEISISDLPENLVKISEAIQRLDQPENINANQSARGKEQPYPDIIEVKSMTASALYAVLKDMFGGQIGGNSFYNTPQSSSSEAIFKSSVKIQVLPGDQSLMVMAIADDNRKIREVVEKIDSNKAGVKKAQENNRGIVSKMVNLHHISSSEAVEALNKLIGGKEGNYGNANAGGSRLFQDVKVDCIELKSSNAILLIGYSGDYDRILDLIHKMDTPPTQVLIEVTILEVTLVNGQSLGFEWGLKKRDLSMQNKYGLSDQMKANSKGFFIQYGNDYLQAVLSAIENNSDVKVLSSPHLLVENNKKAVISIGDSVVINKESIEIPTANAANPIVKTTHEYVDVGLRLEIFTKISDDGVIALDIIQDVNDIKDSGVPGFPQISKRNLTTAIVSKDKELIVLGGLISKKTTMTDTKIPVLGYLPVVGRLFRKSDNSTQSTELVLIMTPTIIKNQADIDQASRDQKEKMERLKNNFFKK